MVSRFILRHHDKCFPLDEVEAGHAIWSTIYSAIVGRAAQQICRLALTDTPLGLPIRALDLHTPRSTSSTLPVVPLLPQDMGINHLQPSPDEEDVAGLFDVLRSSSDSSQPQTDALMPNFYFSLLSYASGGDMPNISQNSKKNKCSSICELRHHQKMNIFDHKMYVNNIFCGSWRCARLFR